MEPVGILAKKCLETCRYALAERCHLLWLFWKMVLHSPLEISDNSKRIFFLVKWKVVMVSIAMHVQ